MCLYPPSQARLSPASSNISITLLWAAGGESEASQEEKVPSQQSRAFNHRPQAQVAWDYRDVYLGPGVFLVNQFVADIVNRGPAIQAGLCTVQLQYTARDTYNSCVPLVQSVTLQALLSSILSPLQSDPPLAGHGAEHCRLLTCTLQVKQPSK